MHVAVTGASGMLGRALVEALRDAGHTVTSFVFSRAAVDADAVRVDLTDDAATAATLDRLLEPPPSDERRLRVFVHAAAERRPDAVARDPERARRLNVDVPGRLAAACASRGVHFVFVSSDYVFDGRSPPYAVDAPTSPLQEYGEHKAAAERELRRHAAALFDSGGGGGDGDAATRGSITVVRLPVLYGRVRTLDESALSLLLEPAVRGGAADDTMRRSPTHTDDVAAIVARRLCPFLVADAPSLSAERPMRTLHISGRDVMTKYTMTLAIARALFADDSDAERDAALARITRAPPPDASSSSTASRPVDPTLDCSVIDALGWREDMRSFDVGLKDMLHCAPVKATKKNADADADAAGQ